MSATPEVRIRPPDRADAAAIAALTTALARRWIVPDCSEDGAATLLASMAEAPTRQRLAEGYRYLVAVQRERIVGVIALRLPAHLYHLFVAEPVQRQGLARRLWQALGRQHPIPQSVTVNASRAAVPVYRRLGFVEQAAERIEHGIPSTPMLWSRRTQSAQHMRPR